MDSATDKTLEMHIKRNLKTHTRLGRQGFAYPRRTAQEHDHTLTCASSVSSQGMNMFCPAPLTFTMDHVVKIILVLHLALGESKNKLFIIFRQNQTIKGTIVPLDFPDGTDQKRHY